MNSEISLETKVELVRRCMQTEEGWNKLALSIGKSPENREKCIEILKIIAGDRDVNVPFVNENGVAEPHTISYIELLTTFLDNHLAKVANEP